MINKVILLGRLTKDPEVRKTQNNLSVCSFTLAVNRRFKSESGPEADFINCIAWRQSADYLSTYATKGSQVAVEGSIQTRNYDDKDGKKVYITEIAVDSLSIISTQKVEKHTEVQETPKPSNVVEFKELDFY